MKIGSFFSGAGLLDLGVIHGLAAGGVAASVAWQVEIEPHCHPVLEKHYPNTCRRIRDVRLACRTYRDLRGNCFDSGTLTPVDIIVAGFPCQDLSLAGKGAGLSGAKSGLWWELWRCLRVLRPRYVVLENVPAIIVRGVESVLGALAVLGYDAEWVVFGADDVGAPHRRKRWMCVARLADTGSGGREASEPSVASRGGSGAADLPDADSDAVRAQQERERGLGGEAGAGTNGTPRRVANPKRDGLEGEFAAGAAQGAACGTRYVAHRHRHRRRRESERRTERDRIEDGQDSRGDIADGCSSEERRDDRAQRASSDALGGLGRVADGLPAWMDWSDDPADSGVIPRAVESRSLTKAQRKQNRERLMMLGNGVVPRWAFEGGLRVAQLEALDA